MTGQVFAFFGFLFLNDLGMHMTRIPIMH